MKSLALIFLLATITFGQTPQDPQCHLYPLRDAKAYFIIHNEGASAPHRKKIEKAIDNASDLKRAKTRDAADFYIDFTESGFVSVIRPARAGSPAEIFQWELKDSNFTSTLPGRVNTVTTSAGGLTLSKTVIVPQRQVRHHIEGDINVSSDILFRLRAARKLWRKLPHLCK
ncbi:MAG: hypothetical protein IPM25_15295 [Chloracidobacterium sp.]|nr:hypothetical protein [Chloracidobacterium sp.]